jgi:hypothetical protein
MKKTLLLIFLCFHIKAQTSMNFEQNLCTGINKCVIGYYGQYAATRLKAETSLCGNSNYTQNTTNPISGEGSLHFEKEIIAQSYVYLTESIITTIAFGADGDTYSFNIRFNNFNGGSSPPLRVDVYCGNYHAFTEYSLADIGQIKNISGTINNSLGGGAIRILISNFSGSLVTNGFFSYDLDDFTSTAKLDLVNNACLKEILPLKLIVFESRNVEDTTILSWRTENETNFSHFEIEKSENGLIFKQMGIVRPNSENANYQFIDQSPIGPINYYRLKMVDLDGTFEYSKIISEVTRKESGTQVVFPNPVTNGTFRIRERNTILKFGFFNSNNQQLPILAKKTNGGYQFELWNKEKPGIYFLQIFTQIEGAKTYKIIIQ